MSIVNSAQLPIEVMGTVTFVYSQCHFRSEENPEPSTTFCDDFFPVRFEFVLDARAGPGLVGR